MNPETQNPLDAALEQIRARVTVIHIGPESVEFMTRKGFWVEIMASPGGYRVRVYRSGSMKEAAASDPNEAIEVSRQLARK